jgi:K+-transporting ATPase KdpF subunit
MTCWSLSSPWPRLSPWVHLCSFVNAYKGVLIAMLEYILVGIVALLVGIYLFAALLRPDWF